MMITTLLTCLHLPRMLLMLVAAPMTRAQSVISSSPKGTKLTRSLRNRDLSLKSCPSVRLEECGTNCDEDYYCKDGLVCYQRTGGSGCFDYGGVADLNVPGCPVASNLYDDYCISPNKFPAKQLWYVGSNKNPSYVFPLRDDRYNGHVPPAIKSKTSESQFPNSKVPIFDYIILTTLRGLLLLLLVVLLPQSAKRFSRQKRLSYRRNGRRTSQPIEEVEEEEDDDESNRKPNTDKLFDCYNTEQESTKSSIEAVSLDNGTTPAAAIKPKTGVKAAARFRSILAALSFESRLVHPSSSPPPRRRRRRPLSTEHTKSEKPQQQQVGSKFCLLRRLRRRNKKTTTTTVQQTNKNGNVTRVECGSSDDVYFDALQFGDASGNQDDFQSKSQPRESIVLSGVSIETVLGAVTDDDDDDDDNTSSAPSSGDDDLTADTEEDRTSITVTSTKRRRPAVGPPPPQELPLRFLRAGKLDPMEGLRRYEATLKMRAEQRLDTILREPSFEYAAIKQHYPQYCHCKGRLGEPCFYELPPRINLKALHEVGVNVDKLMRHYTMATEYQWQYLERDDLAKSIYIIDLAGMRMTDFAGEAVEFLKRGSKFSAQHYPERAGYVFVINVPAWFKIIWTVVKPIIDESTLQKISILRGKDEIRQNMLERIALENIPPEYGGTSMPLGQSPEEQTSAEWMEHNNALARAGQTACAAGMACRFCDWTPARSY